MDRAGCRALVVRLSRSAGATRWAALAAVLGLGWLSWLWRFPMATRLKFVGLGAIAGALTSGPFWGVYMVKTGRLVPASGVSRNMVARRGALTLRLGDLWFYGRPVAYVLAYLPLAAGRSPRCAGPARRTLRAI